MEFLKEIKELLLKIQRNYGSSRTEYINTVSDKIAYDISEGDAILASDLACLISDLGFYEPDELDRDAELGYYGDKQLTEIITEAIKMIDQYLKSNF